MDELVVCPNCGETNPADLPYCRNCQWRLHTLNSDWDSLDARNAPGSEDGAPSDDAGGESLPDWLQQPSTTPGPGKSSDEAAAAKLRERLDAEGAEDLMATASSRREPEDLLAGLTRAEQADEEPIPDWVARIMGISETDDSLQDQDRGSVDEANSDAHVQAAALSNIDTGEESPWRDHDGMAPLPYEAPDLQETQGAASSPSDSTIGGRESDEIYAWLRQLDADNVAPPMPLRGKDVPATTDVPTWVGRMMGVSAEDAAPVEEPRSSLPDWLRSTAADDDALVASRPAVSAEPPEADQAPSASVSEPPVQLPTSPDPAREMPVAPLPPNASSETDTLDVDAVFAAMDMPNWPESAAASGPPASEPAVPVTQSEEPITPADLPSWVQAMRPLESTVAAAESRAGPLQSEVPGALAGLKGVLPAGTGVFVSPSRPKPQAMRLDVSEQQRSQARLLEDMLEAEVRPLPLQGTMAAGTPRVLRWMVSALILGAVGLGLVSASNRFVFPAAVAAESNAAIQVVQSLPPDAAVLAVFDYEPATAGEMEVAGAALMDHLLLLKHPRLALVSTSPTGSALAERFVSTTLSERSYARNVQYADLGFLPGGFAGVQLFSGLPIAALPYGAAMDPVWDSPVLHGITALSDFGAIIVLTDSLESGGVWIEQTTGRRAAVPLIVVASAQVGPMLLPYYDSGQLQGLVIGIHGAAGTELANGGNPGIVRRYWDAYNLGLYAAVLLIVLGAIWHGLRATVRGRLEST